MRKWLRKWLGIDAFETTTGHFIDAILQKYNQSIASADLKIQALEAEMQTRLEENRFLSRKLDMLSQGVVPPAPEIIKGQDEAQEC